MRNPNLDAQDIRLQLQDLILGLPILQRRSHCGFESGRRGDCVAEAASGGFVMLSPISLLLPKWRCRCRRIPEVHNKAIGDEQQKKQAGRVDARRV